MRAFPLIRDLVTDVSWNYAVNGRSSRSRPPADVPQEDWRWQQQDIERVQEFRKCIECFLCQDVCHVLRNHETEQPFMGPRYLVRTAGLEMHPMDKADRTRYLKDDAAGSATATSRSAAPRCARSTSRSRTTRSSRSRSGSRTSTTTRSGWSGASLRKRRKSAPAPGRRRRMSVRARRHDAVRGVTLWGDEPAGRPDPAPAAGRRFVDPDGRCGPRQPGTGIAWARC